MADYKVIFRADETTRDEHRTLWEPGCPAFATVVQVSRNTETASAYLQIKIRNISDGVIKSVAGVAEITYLDDTSEDFVFEDLDVDLGPANQKPLKAQPLPKGDVASVEVAFTSVLTESERWKSSGEPSDIPNNHPLELSERAMAERRRRLQSAGIDARALDNSVEDHDSWWACACGQVNVNRDTCCECGASKHTLLANEEEESLVSSADEWSEGMYQKAVKLASDSENIDSVTTAASLFQQIRGWKDSDERFAACNAAIEDRKAKSAHKTKRIAIVIGAIVAVSAAAVLFVVNVVIPDGKYNDAVGLANAGQYDEAVAAFQKLGNYKDSNVQIVATYAKQCTAQLDAGDNDAAMSTNKKMKSAAAELQISPDISRDAASKAMDEKNYVIAAFWYDLLGDKERAKEAEYAYASLHQDRNDELTYEYLADLKESGYKDSADLYSALFDWRFEFAIATYDAFHDKNWVDMTTYDQKDRGFTMIELLVRAKSGPPKQTKTLHMEEWRIKAKNMIGYTGDWIRTTSSDWGNWTDKVDVTSDGEICKGYMGDDYHTEAFRVKVTDPGTREVLYEGEIHRNE